jgi:hypothetical protein
VTGRRGSVRTRAVVASVVTVVVMGLAAWDASRPPARQLGVRVACAALELHRATSAVWLAGSGIRCRFEPSCSVYAEQVLLDRGWLRGAPYIGRRLARCGPWTPAVTSDPWPGAVVAPVAPTPLPSESPSATAKE